MKMHATIAANSVEKVVSAIQALDLEPVKSRVMDAELGEGWSREYADSVEAAYKTFLTMLVKYPDDSGDIMLAKDVDEFWHTHILQTLKYTQDCEQTFGFYLHHYPHVGERTAKDLAHRKALAAKTQELYAREFGAQHADTAWAGNVAKPATAAYSAARTQSDIVAVPAQDIRAGNAAYSTGPRVAAIRTEDAAYSTGPRIAAIRAENGAYSTGPRVAAIRAEDAAYSTGPRIDAIRAEDAAFSTGPDIAGMLAQSVPQTVVV